MDNQNFIQNFERKVKETISKYKLCSKKDKIIVACSGGKDSTATLYLLKKFGYKAEGLYLNLWIGDWSKKNLENISWFCREQGIKLHIIDIKKELGGGMCFFRSNVQGRAKMSNCLICGVIKRWLLNKKARELGATKLATGHNLDDEAETILMNLLKGNLGLVAGMGPAGGVIKDRKFVPRIKPLYFCLNEEVKKYSLLNGFPVIYKPCPCASETLFRRKIRKELKEIGKRNPKAKENIVKSFLRMLPGLRKKYKAGEKINYCRVCREPSRGEVCKVCGLMGGVEKTKKVDE